MKMWSWVLIGFLVCIIVVLAVKIYLMQKSAQEIQAGFAEWLMTETNTLLTISTHDKYMRMLAESLNAELRTLRSMRHRYQQGDLELKEAVANISHDLRTPLTAICGYLDLLQQLPEQTIGQEEKEKAAKRYLDVIENRTEVMKQLIEELFRYSVVVSAIKGSTREEVVLNHALEESVSVNYAALKRKNITPDIFIPEKHVKCRLNKYALSRIFGNLISNAIKYSDGDLKITLTENGEVIFANHALLLDEVQTGKLFDRFYTVDTATKSTGLGLSIAKVLTEQMGGTISAQYAEGVLSIRLFFPKQ